MLSPIALEQFFKTGFLSLSDTQISLEVFYFTYFPSITDIYFFN